MSRALAGLVRLFALAASLATLSQEAGAQEPAPASPPSPPPAAEPAPEIGPSLAALRERKFDEAASAELESLLAATEPPAEFSDDQKAAWKNRRREVAIRLDAVGQQLARAQEFERDANPADVQRRVESLKSSLAVPSAEAAIPAEIPLAELEQLVGAKQAEVAKRHEQFAAAEAEIQRRTARRAEIPKLIATAGLRLEELDSQLAGAMVGEPPDAERQLARAELLAEKLLKRADAEALKRELQKYDATAEALSLDHDRAARDLARDEKELKQLRDAVAQQRKADAERSAREAHLALLQAAGADPLVRGIAEENAELAEARTVLADKQQFRALQLDREKRIYAPLLKSFADLRAREKLAESVDRSALLHLQVKMLPAAAEFREKMKHVAIDLAEAQYANLEYQSEWSRLADLDGEIESLLPTDGERPELLEQALRQHLEAKRNNLVALRQASEQYIQQLTALQTFWEETAIDAAEFREYIAERILWARSTAPVELARLTSGKGWLALAESAKTAALWIGSPERWRDTLYALGRDIRHNALLWLGALAGCAALVALRPRLRKRVREEGQIAARRNVDVFRPTAIAALCSFVLSIVWLAGPAFLGWRLLRVSTPGSHTSALGVGLLMTLVVCHPLEFLRQVCRPGGLGDAHFDWPPKAISLLRRSIRRLTLLTVPLVLTSAMLYHFASGVQPAARGWTARLAAGQTIEWHESMGRLAFMTLMLCVAGFIQHVMRPGVGVFDDVLARNRGGWFDRLRWVWFAVAVGAPLALAGLAAAGYYYTAVQLAWRLAATLDLLLGLLLLQAMLLRLLLVVRRRLAMEQARQRRAALLENREASGGETTEIVLEPERLDLAVVSQQTRHLLQSALICAAMVGLCAVWVDVLPALKKLNAYHFWTGSEITLGNLVMAGLFAMMTFLAARNLPGLLEMSILQRLPLQPGSGYAITTICRYCTVVIGIIATSQPLGIEWSQVQWLVAAISVGLGFGLQEIFGNFISGLIILFERPIRVGDVITVGAVTGAVSKIRMRATTILDGDRRELIVPNKEFITGQVVNWTLSDDVNRLTIRIQVEYPCDPTLPQALMLKAAQEHPNVLPEPAPVAHLEEVREHSLQFVLYAYLPNLAVGGKTRHELLAAITNSFDEHEVELASPHIDLRNLQIESPARRQARRSA